jgi:hypothetical protein
MIDVGNVAKVCLSLAFDALFLSDHADYAFLCMSRLSSTRCVHPPSWSIIFADSGTLCSCFAPIAFYSAFRFSYQLVTC